MKKISLFLLASFFSMGVFAQTAPAATPATAPATNTGSKAALRSAGANSSGATKNNLKKTSPHKKVTHHITPVKKAGASPQTKDAPNGDIKK